jgi:hypothetical protein
MHALREIDDLFETPCADLEHLRHDLLSVVRSDIIIDDRALGRKRLPRPPCGGNL